MDFDFRQPRHLLAFVLLSISFLVLIVYAAVTYFEPSPSTSGIGNFTGVMQLIVEIYLVAFSLILVIILMVVIPMLWYVLVNRLRFPEILQRLRLSREHLGQALFWGIITAIAALMLSVILDIVILQFGVDISKLSNIPQLQQLFPLPALLVLITVQPIAEEIFFRGFLLEKISGFTGPTIGVIGSAVLFGVAHLSYGMLYTAVMATGLGLLFGIVVVRTKNLYASMLAHILVNITSITLFLLGKSIGV